MVFVGKGAINSSIYHAMMIASYDSSTDMFQLFDPATGLFMDVTYTQLQSQYANSSSPHIYRITGQK